MPTTTINPASEIGGQFLVAGPMEGVHAFFGTGAGAISARGATSLTYTYSTGWNITYTGAFTYDSAGNASGTFTGYAIRNSFGGLEVTGTGYNNSFDMTTPTKSLFLGADNYVGSNAPDLIHTLAGNDTIQTFQGIDIINAGDGDDEIRAGQGMDTIDGAGGNDLIYGGKGVDMIMAGDGADNIFGGLGDDVVDAGRGADTIRGAAGNDRLTGNSDADRFVFGTGAGNDTITDFSGTAGDRIAIEGGLQWTVTASGRDTLITLSSGDTILLQQVSTSTFQAGWIFNA